MANMFVLILVWLTLGTGIIWCLERFFLGPRRRARIAALCHQQQSAINVDALAAQTLPPKWIESSAAAFPVLAIVLIIRSFLYEPFQIPSGSMMPTLLIGDFILVEKFAYGIKEPVGQNTLIATGHPKRGDIAVFKYPRDPSVDYIKRVIGLPGDKVVYDSVSKELTIYPACGDSPCPTALPLRYSAPQPSEWVESFSQHNGGEVGSRFDLLPINQAVANGYRMQQREEIFGALSAPEATNNAPIQKKHQILIVAQAQDVPQRYYQQLGEPLGTWIVPPGHYFMMGDNRDNSADSRYWGFVPEKNLVGKAVAIWMSFKKQEGEWPTGVRLERIGAIE